MASAMGNRAFAYDSLTLADRWLLQMVARSIHHNHDYPDEEGEDEDEKPRKEEGG